MALKTRQSSYLAGFENRPMQKTRQSMLPSASQRCALAEIGNIMRQQNARASICVEMSKGDTGSTLKSQLRRSIRLSVSTQANPNQPRKDPKSNNDKPVKKPVSLVPKDGRRRVLSPILACGDSNGPSKRKSAVAKRAPRLTMKPPPVETPPEERRAVQNKIRQSLAAERNRRPTLAVPSHTQDVPVIVEKIRVKNKHQISRAEKKEIPCISEKDDIDLSQRQNFWAMTTYSKMIYSYLHKLDRREYAKINQKQFDAKVTTRTKLIEWMASAYVQLHLLQETFQLSVSILDRYLMKAVDIKEIKLELVAVTCVSLAIKYEELLTSLVRELLSLSSRHYTLKEFIQMEAEIMNVISFQVARPVPLVFLRRYNTAGKCDRKQHSYGKYLIDLAQLDPTLAHLSASSLAAATVFVCTTLKSLRVDTESWSPVMVYYTSSTLDSLKPVVSRIASLVLPGGPQCQSLKRLYAAEASYLSTGRIQLFLASLRDLCNS